MRQILHFWRWQLVWSILFNSINSSNAGMFTQSLQRWIRVEKGPMQEGCRKLQNCCSKIPFTDTHTTTNQAYIIFRIHIRITSVALQCGNAALFNNRVPHHGADDAIQIMIYCVPPTPHSMLTSSLLVQPANKWSIDYYLRWTQPSHWMSATWSLRQPKRWGPQPKRRAQQQARWRDKHQPWDPLDKQQQCKAQQ